MRSAAHAAQRAVHSHQYGRHAAPPPGELTLPAFWVAFTVFWVVPSTSVLGLGIGRVLGWGNLETIALAADTASAAFMESTFEPQTVCTPAATESDATASTNAPNTRPAEVLETHPAFIELPHKALATRAVRLKSKLHEPCVECSTSGKRLKDAESVIVLAQPRHATELSNQKKGLTFQAWQAG